MLGAKRQGQSQEEECKRLFECTVTTDKPFDQAVAAVETKAAEKGFNVLYTRPGSDARGEGVSTRAPQDRRNLQRQVRK